MLRGFHKLCDKGLWEEARHLLHDKSENANMARETAAEPGGYGEWTALHIACKRDPPADVIRNLCELSVTPAETFDLYNKLPIHYAAEYGADVKVMQALIECCPRCLSGVDSEGRTALHLSFKYSIKDPATLVDPMREFPGIEEVTTLLGDETDVIWATDENDYTPLHYAVSNIDYFDLKVVEKLVNTDVNSVLAQTKAGLTPLHLALLKTTERSITVEIAQLLLGVTPEGKESIEEEFEGTRMLSGSDMLPLHYACQNIERVPLDTLQLILDRYPTAAAAEALEVGYPLHILESHRTAFKDKHDRNIFNKKSDMLFAYHPNILPHRTDRERLKRFKDKIISELSSTNSSLSEETKSIWTWMCMFPEKLDKESLYPEIVKEILEEVEDAGSAKMLACMTISRVDEEYTPLYQATSPTIAKVLSPYLRFVDRYEMKKDGVIESASTMIVKAYDSTYAEEDERSNVVITFYSNREEFWQEVDVHMKLKKTADLESLTSPAITIIQTFDKDRMGTSLETSDDTKFTRDITKFNDIYPNIAGYLYGIVREGSGETVDSLSNYNCVDNKFRIQNKKHVKDIAESVLCLHKNNYILGGMKVEDFVQLNGGTIKLQNVKSIVEVDRKSKLHTKFYGCVTDEFDISNLPPEMITKLDSEGVEKYTSYWSRVSNDFNIANELTPEQVKESDKLKTYLEEEGCTFEDFWTRVENNAALWKRIQPRQVGGYYYVVKCFRAGVDGGVHHVEELPYDLVPNSTSLDIWFFGSVMFELITGESLFHSNKAGNIVNDSDFERLFNWTMADHTASRRFSDINDPLGRHLLRSLLTSPNTLRQRNMETVLKHQFFLEDENEAVTKFSRDIVLEEKEEARKYKIEQDLKLRKDNLDKRTEDLSLISPETQLKFEQSQWKLLMSTHDLSELTFPTSCIVLPYELEKTPYGDLCASKRNTALGHKLGLIIADILHYLNIVTDIKPRWSGQSFGHKTQEYISMNRGSASVPEDTIVKICEGAIRKAQNAATIVAEVIVGFISSGDGVSVAHKLISDTLRDIVDLDVCGRVVASAEAAHKSISSLLETLGDFPGKSAESMMNEQMKEILGVSFTENSFAKKESVQNALMSIVQEIAENPLSVMEELLESKMRELTNVYTEMEACHVYLVDEYSGLPVASESNSFTMSFSSDIAKTLIPPTLLAMRSNFPFGIVPLLGLTLEELPEQWAKIPDFEVSYVQSNPASELQILQTILGIDEDVNMISLLKQFHAKNDQEEDFSGLRRLRSPNGLMIWVTKKSRQQALQQAKQGLVELQALKAIEARERVTNATKDKSKNNVASLWCDAIVSFAQTSQTNLSSPSSGRGSPVSHQRQWKNNKDFDKEQYSEQRNDIQQKLDKLKGRKTAPPTESSRSGVSMDNTTNPDIFKGTRTDFEDSTYQTLDKLKGWKSAQRTESNRLDGLTENATNKHKRNNIEDYPAANDGTRGECQRPSTASSIRNSEPRAIHDHRSTADPEPCVETTRVETTQSQMNSSEGQVSTQTSEATSVDENEDKGNMIPDVTEKISSKHHTGGDAGVEVSGRIQIESLQPVRSDINESYVKDQWSPILSDDEEQSEDDEDRDEISETLSTVPKILRPSQKSNQKRRIFDRRDASNDTTPIASPRVITNRLRPKSGSLSPGKKRAPTPGGRSISGEHSVRTLSGTSKTGSSKTPKSIHSKKRVTHLSLDNDDNDSYFRAPTSRSDRIRPEMN